MQTLKAFGLLPWGLVSLGLGMVGQGWAMGEVVAHERKVPRELSVNSQKDGFLGPNLVFLLLAVLQEKLARGAEHCWVF